MRQMMVHHPRHSLIIRGTLNECANMFMHDCGWTQEQAENYARANDEYRLDKDPPIVHPPTQLSGGSQPQPKPVWTQIALSAVALAISLLLIFCVKVEIHWPFEATP